MDYTQLASEESLQKTVAALTAKNFKPLVLENGITALEYVKSNVPHGVSVMNGASVTLEQIGFIDFLKTGKSGWNNLHDAVLAEADPDKQAELRKHTVVSDYYFGSVHAVSETGELVISSNSGSQLPHLAYTSPNLMLIVGVQKIVPTLEDAMRRIAEHVLPLEDARMKERYGYGTQRSKTLILHAENPGMQRSVNVLLVKEKLGF